MVKYLVIIFLGHFLFSSCRIHSPVVIVIFNNRGLVGSVWEMVSILILSSMVCMVCLAVVGAGPRALYPPLVLILTMVMTLTVTMTNVWMSSRFPRVPISWCCCVVQTSNWALQFLPWSLVSLLM